MVRYSDVSGYDEGDLSIETYSNIGLDRMQIVLRRESNVLEVPNIHTLNDATIEQSLYLNNGGSLGPMTHIHSPVSSDGTLFPNFSVIAAKVTGGIPSGGGQLLSYNDRALLSSGAIDTSFSVFGNIAVPDEGLLLITANINYTFGAVTGYIEADLYHTDITPSAASVPMSTQYSFYYAEAGTNKHTFNYSVLLHKDSNTFSANDFQLRLKRIGGAVSVIASECYINVTRLA